MDAPPARVLIAEDHALVREGLKLLLSLNPALQIAGDTGNGQDVLPLVGALQPDLVLLDLDLPQRHGAEIAMAIKRDHPGVKVLILTGNLHPAEVRRALTAGADGYVVKHENSHELQRAIPLVLAGQCFISRAVAEAVEDNTAPINTPTPRELEILTWFAQGKSSKEVASILGLSVNTVRTHRQNLMEKLGLHNAAELTAWAIRHQIHPAAQSLL